MRAGNKFWWFVSIAVTIVIVILSVLAVLLWRGLLPEEKTVLLHLLQSNAIYLFAVVFLVLAGVGFTLDGIFHIYILPIARLKEDLTIINTVNPSHRVGTEGSRDITALAAGINDAVGRVERLREGVGPRYEDALAEVEQEKNTLAVLMNELSEGVVVCNADGRILLYNQQARECLSGRVNSEIGKGLDPAVATGRFIGLGRSIFGLVDRNLILHGLEEIAEKIGREEGLATSSFVLSGHGDRFLHVEVSPILDHHKHLTGFILILFDITLQLEADEHMNRIFQGFIQRSRASLGAIRSAVEATIDFPGMDDLQQDRFHQIILNEAVLLGKHLDQTVAAFSGGSLQRWPLARTRAIDLLEIVKTKARDQIGVELIIDGAAEGIFLKVDICSLSLGIIFALERLANFSGQRRFDMNLRREGNFVGLDLSWDGDPVLYDRLSEWANRPLQVAGEHFPLTFRAIVENHEAEIWSFAGGNGAEKSRLTLLLPEAESSGPEKIRNITILPQSRPEFYDFDLFNQAGQNPELDSCRLNELTYTVFDTETTGLNPNAGDEIISIGAVRVVNSRLLSTEIFDQLVDPRRPLSRESIRIHGIQPEMLDGQPIVEDVLPLFHRFAEGTILVAHNAAFDMRMLQLKEEGTGVRFVNPVLDTMLLSAILHPAQQSHNLEDIAQRLGISIVGRHTALGDAIATAEIFLKQLSLLDQNGIRTLREARTASQKTFYARKKY